MIKQRYIDEANRIRERYHNELKKLSLKEEKILKDKVRLNDIMVEIKKYIDNNKKLDETIIMNDLKNEINEIDSTMEIIKKDVETLKTNIEKLKNDSKFLYEKITEEHPDLTEIEIQKVILYSLKN